MLTVSKSTDPAAGTGLHQPAHQPAGSLNYTTAATRWFDGLPIGNGRIGGMVLSAESGDRIQLSESTNWSGAASATDVPAEALEYLPVVRDLLFSGDYAKAQELTTKHLLGRPSAFGTNLPLPELRLDFSSADAGTTVSRQLNLDTGIVAARSSQSLNSVSRETFCSNPDRVLVTRITADSAPIDLVVYFGPAVVPARISLADGDLVLNGHAHETLHSDGATGTTFQIRVRVIAEQRPSWDRNRLNVTGSHEVTVIVAIGTDWGGDDPQTQATAAIDAATTLGYSALRKRHVADHAALMGRVSIDLGTSAERLRTLPTDGRRAALAGGADDNELLALYFQYGRYLTIAGSRADSPLPLALQGLWNDGLASSAPWTNDFHLDINTQQNYWAAEIAALPESHEPLLGLIERLRGSGRETAQRMYGAPGWVAHTVTNAWGYSAAGSGLGWGLNVTGGAWIALQLWEHFEYSGDLDFLEQRAYPVIREAVEFFLDYLVEDPESGWLVTGPSESPENWFLAPDGTKSAVSMGSTADRVFVAALLRIVLESAELLDVDHGDFERRVELAVEKLPPFQVGQHGQLQEWLHDFDEAVPSHRHTSHLSAIYPERQITPRETPELAAAAEITLQRRQAAPGWEQTEWVEANMMVYSARLLDGDNVLFHLRNLIADASEANLMSFSAGGVAGAAQNIYSFDGNTGATAGIAEALVQSTRQEIELLPALPSAWRTGSVAGLRARGGIEVDVAWTDGDLATAVLRSARTVDVTVRYGEETIPVRVAGGSPVTITLLAE